jgi:type IV pilus assembly protein PilV
MKPISLPTRRVHPGRGRQTGVMLLEALIAILIFSIGILSIVGMQATAIQNMGEAKYRSDAAFLANQIVADMWGNSTNLAGYAYAGSGTVPPLLLNWMNTAQSKLPGVDVAGKKNLPIITVVNNTVTVTVRWQEGRDLSLAAPPHGYAVVAYINCCL